MKGPEPHRRARNRNTARVICEVGADTVGVVEAEDRLTLARVTDSLILAAGAAEPRYPHVMVIDGNDPRGIDVGILSTDAYPLTSMRSHIDDGPHGDRIFSRDAEDMADMLVTSCAARSELDIGLSVDRPVVPRVLCESVQQQRDAEVEGDAWR